MQPKMQTLRFFCFSDQQGMGKIDFRTNATAPILHLLLTRLGSSVE